MLEEYGIEVMSAPARALFRKAGAVVDEATQLVRADRGLIEAAIASALQDVTGASAAVLRSEGRNRQLEGLDDERGLAD